MEGSVVLGLLVQHLQEMGVSARQLTRGSVVDQDDFALIEDHLLHRTA
jgi:hypothetical protein